MTLRTCKIRSGDARRGGLTLVELIIVMAMIVVAFGIAFPSLRGFIRGRALDSEANRFLALTRYGQSRAVSEGVPMELWMDPKQGTYGLQAQPGFMDADGKAVEFDLDGGLQIEAEPAADQPRTAAPQPNAGRDTNRPTIRFMPDGFPDPTSPARVRIHQGDADSLWIGRSQNRLNYEIQTQASAGRP